MRRKKYAEIKETRKALPSQHPANYFVPVIEKAKYSIVSIETRDRGSSGREFNRFVLQFLFPDAEIHTPATRSFGTGFIIHPKGYILTSEHVIHQAKYIYVKLYNNAVSQGEVVWKDRERDLAVLKIQARKPLPVLPLGSSRDAKVGEWVIAIGNPVGLDNTVTTGVISAKNRPVRIAGRQYEDVIQTDAAINPGNSGGPLINIYGEVIGMNAFILKETQSLGFAIGIDSIKPHIRPYLP
ncbi:hypothetical protein BSNK01_27330 [Bacillaceae bacterium]